jgi:hypothetical protein
VDRRRPEKDNGDASDADPLRELLEVLSAATKSGTGSSDVPYKSQREQLRST